MAKRRRKEQAESSGERSPPLKSIPRAATVRVVQQVLLAELRIHKQGTIELVHRKCLFEKDAGHLIGIAVNALARAGKIIRVELRHSQRRQAHGRFVSVWRLAA
jgi:hypothetical protein